MIWALVFAWALAFYLGWQNVRANRALRMMHELNVKMAHMLVEKSSEAELYKAQTEIVRAQLLRATVRSYEDGGNSRFPLG